MGCGASQFQDVVMVSQNNPVAGVDKKYCRNSEANLQYYRCLETGAYLVKDVDTGKKVFTIDGARGTVANNYLGTKNFNFNKTIVDENDQVLLHMDARDVNRQTITGRVDVSNSDGKVLYSVERSGAFTFKDHVSGKTFTIEIEADYALNNYCVYLSKSSSPSDDKECIAKVEKRGANAYICIVPNVDVTMLVSMYLARRQMVTVMTGGQALGEEMTAAALISEIRN